MYKLLPYQYVHVADHNLCTTRIVCGPLNYYPQDHEYVITGETPLNFIFLSLNSYAFIRNPVVLDQKGEPTYDKNGQVVVRTGDEEIRTDATHSQPFPLYPGEELVKKENLPVIPRNNALLVVANRDFEDKKAGCEYLIYGPKIYIPRIEETIIKIQNPIVVKQNSALQIRAKYQCKDIYGTTRTAGEEWLIFERGNYLLQACEEFVMEVKANIITDQKCIMVEALKTFKDSYKQERKVGEQWLITKQLNSAHILGVFEKKVKDVYLTVLGENQYCYVNDPYNETAKKNTIGEKVLRLGPTSFFLQPGEFLLEGIKDVYLLSDDEALLVQSLEDVLAEEKLAGEKWLIKGPLRYIPPISIRVLEYRKSLPMDAPEGIYVKNIITGEVKLVKGHTYMLSETEELWDMEVSDTVEAIISAANHGIPRIKSNMLTFKCPFNAAVQKYNFKTKTKDVEIGPKLVYLEPDEQFTLSFLSGNCPKTPGRIVTLHVMLGPAFSTDSVKAETCDHARIEIKLSYNWKFDEAVINSKDNDKIFSARDFIGDFCKDMAARVRGIVATITFEQFHKSCCRIIRKAIFGLNKSEHINDFTYFDYNGLMVFNVDIQTVEPCDEDIKEKLRLSVQQSIEIVTHMQELEARQRADTKDLQCRIKIDNKKIENMLFYEKQLIKLNESIALTQEIQAKGEVKAEEEAKLVHKKLMGEANVCKASYEVSSKKIGTDWELEIQKLQFNEELNFKTAMKNLAIEKEILLSKIRCDKFKKIMNALGKDTLLQMSIGANIAKAEIMCSLGLKGYVLMDKKKPMNLISTAEGMLGSSNTNLMIEEGKEEENSDDNASQASSVVSRHSKRSNRSSRGSRSKKLKGKKPKAEVD